MCCAAHALHTVPAWAGTGAKVFICTAPDLQHSSGIETQQYGATNGIGVSNLAGVGASIGITPYGVGFVRDRWRLGDGIQSGHPELIVLGVSFLGGSDDAKALVRQVAPEWLLGANPPPVSFRFDVPVQDSQLRIAFEPGKGNWSQIGRGNLALPKDQPTMNIADLDSWVLRHEFGHALGLRHELLHPDLPFQWNEAVVIAEVEAIQPDLDRRLY